MFVHASLSSCNLVGTPYFNHVETADFLFKHFTFLVWRNSGVSHWSRISRLPEQPCWLYAQIALRQHSPLPREFYPSKKLVEPKMLDWSHENWYFHLDISRWLMGVYVYLAGNQYSDFKALKPWSGRSRKVSLFPRGFFSGFHFLYLFVSSRPKKNGSSRMPQNFNR